MAEIFSLHDWNAISRICRVPEHSLPLMAAYSRGEAARTGDYVYYYSQNWLTFIGYPLSGHFSTESFTDALTATERQIQPEFTFAIAPELPDYLKRNITEKDRYYLLSAHATVPTRLRNPIQRAGELLQVSESSGFTPAHRRLWAEFLQKNSRAMSDTVAELYARTPQAMANAGSALRFLNACDSDGNLAACLLLDFSPDNFVSYVIGAHSRSHYVPHASDLLFAKMLELARERNKKFIHLGLGVNDGILRFKKKWGAKPGLPYLAAQWQNSGKEEAAGTILARAILNYGASSSTQFLETQARQLPFAMLWQVEKNGRRSWLGGTAHFFLHSFESSFRSLFKHVDSVIFEGPLDTAFMDQVDQAGKNLPPDAKPLIDSLTEAEIAQLERTVNGPGNFVARILELEKTGQVDVRRLLRNSRPWYAFFALWTSFLERIGWRQSVDMEAWTIALAMNKNVIGMETLEEQLESLDSLPPQRALNFFRSCRTWKHRARSNLKAYLAGDLERMMGSSAEFPTRTEHIVSRRDQRFRERMRPWLEVGGAAVFVGAAHLVNLRQMLAEDGFKIRQVPYGLWPRLHLGWRQLTRPGEKVTW